MKKTVAGGIVIALIILNACSLSNDRAEHASSVGILLDSIKLVEHSNIFKTRDLASQLLLIENEDAQMYGEFYMLFSDFHQVNSQETRDQLDLMYKSLGDDKSSKEIRLKIDFMLLEHFYGQRNYENASARIEEAFTLLTAPELELERAVLTYGLSIVQPFHSNEQSYAEIKSFLSNPQYQDLWNWNTSKLHLSLARHALRLGNVEEAENLFLECIRKNNKNNLHSLNSYIYAIMAIIYEDKSLGRTITFAERSLANSQKTGFTKDLSIRYRTLGHYSNNLKDFEEGFKYYLKAIETDSISNSQTGLSLDHAYAGWAYFKINPEENLDSAEVFWDKALLIAESLDNQSYTPFIMTYQRRLWAYLHSGLEEKALPVKKTLTEYQIKSANSQTKLQNLYVNSLIGMKSKGNKVDLLTLGKQMSNDTLRAQKLLIFLISAIAILIAALLYTVRSNLKKAIRSNNRLTDKSEVIALQNEALKQTKRQLELELKSKLSLLSNNLSSFDEFNKKLVDEPLIPMKVKKHLLSLVDSKNNKRILEEIDFQLLGQNEAFYNKLTQLHPNLTAYNLKLCMYLKMNLSTKEVASLLFVTPDTIKVAKGRIRKKINISDKEITLSTYLNSI